MGKTSFTDRNGDKWKVHIDLPKARRLATATGIDIFNTQHLHTLMESFGVRMEFLFHALAEQHDENDVPDLGEFERRLHGGDGVIFKASDALLEAFISFFQRLGLHPAVTIVETYLSISRELVKETATPEFANRVKKETKAAKRAALADTLGE